MNAVISTSVIRQALGLVVASVAISMPVSGFASGGNGNGNGNSGGNGNAGGQIQAEQAPACSIESNLTAVVVTLGPNGRSVSGSGSAGSVTVRCNTDQATVTIGSDAMFNGGTINENELTLFTNSIDFTARAAGTFAVAGTGGSSSGSGGPNNPNGNSFGCGNGIGGGQPADGVKRRGRPECVSGVGSGGDLEIVSRGDSSNTGEITSPLITLNVSAINFETLTKMPIAGTYRGRICITVDPAGVNGQGSGRCSS